MKIRTRIGLILGGALVFTVTAPVAIFLARGFSYDFTKNQIVKTGTLVVKTDPRDAEVKLDGKKIKSTPLVKRFLLPREYQIEVSKPGYETWKNRIEIREQQVTVLPEGDSDKIFLLLDSPKQTEISTTTQDFYVAATGRIYFLEKKTGWFVSSFDSGGGEKKVEIQFDRNFQKPQIIDQSSGQFLIKDSDQYWYEAAAVPTPLPMALDKARLTQISQGVLGIDKKNQLVSYDVLTQNQKIMATSVQNFGVGKDGTIYYLSLESQPGLFKISLDGQINLVQKLLPPFLTSQLIITSDEQIFLLLDDSLFSLGKNLEKINDHVTRANWDSPDQTLSYGNQHEAWVYDPVGRVANELVARSAEAIGELTYKKKYGYIFLGQHGEIRAREANFTGQPNTYVLATTKTSYPKFAISTDSTYLTYLDGTNLITLKIR